MKNLLIFLLCLLGVSAMGQNPVVRQAFTTNTLPAVVDTGLSTLSNVASLYSPSNNAAVTAMSISGSLISYPSYPSADTRLQANHGDSHGGDGTEYQLVYNRIAIVPISGSVLQIGNGGDFSLGVLLNGMAIPANEMGNSATLDFLYQYNPAVNTNLSWSGKWDMRATNYNQTTGNSTLDFWVVTTNQAFSVEGGDLTYSSNNVLSLDSAGYMRVKGATSHAVTSSTAGSTYAVGFGSGTTDWDVVNLVTATTFSISGLPITNQQQEVNVLVYPGLTGKSVTMPAGPIWTSESGLAIAPTNVPASNVMTLSFNAVYGATTNIIAHYSLAPYTPVLDPLTTAFVTQSGITSATEKDGMNNFYIELRNANIITNCLDGFWVFCSSASTPTNGAKVNAIDPNHTNYWLRLNGSSSQFTLGSQGLAGDGTNFFADTQFNPTSPSLGSANYTQSSVSMGCYSKFVPGGQAGAPVGWCPIGMQGSPGTAIYNNPTNTVNYRGPNGSSVGTVTWSPGWQEMTLTGPTGTLISGANSGGGAVTTNGIPNETCYICAENNGGADRWTSNSIACAWIGRFKTPTEQTAFSNAVVHLVTALGRQ